MTSVFLTRKPSAFLRFERRDKMLISLSYIFLAGMFLSWLCKKMRLPGLLGMIFTGILLGPYCLGLIDSSLLNISSELRKIALIIILMLNASRIES